MKTYPPGQLSIEYRSTDGKRFQRCSRCHDAHEMSPLLLRESKSTLKPIMVGNDLVGLICDSCLHVTERIIQQLFPDQHAFPFVDGRFQLLPNPRCEKGHPLIYTEDGNSMTCHQCNEDALTLTSGG